MGYLKNMIFVEMLNETRVEIVRQFLTKLKKE